MGPTSRKLVDAARAGLDPSADAKARVRARIAMAVGGATAAPAPAVKASSSLIAKLAIIGTITAVVGGVTWMAARPAVPAVAPVIEVSEREHVVATPVSSSSSVHENPAPPQPRARVEAPVVTTPVGVAPAPAPAEITLAREVALIDRAMAAAKANDPDAALAALATYEREAAGHGQLAEDAAALTIDVKCRAHQPVAELLRDFDQRYPTSAQRARLERRCNLPR